MSGGRDRDRTQARRATRPVRRRVGDAVAGLAAIGAVLMFAGAAHAGGRPPQPPELPPDADQLAEEFFGLLAEELGLPSSELVLGEITGPPGEYDLPPGVARFVGADNVAVATELPDGGGSSLTGPCFGIAVSLGPGKGGQRRVIDAAADFDDAAPPVDLLDADKDGTPRQAFTADNPFRVHVNGIVVYTGFAGEPPIDHRWFIRTQGISLDSGGDPNPRGKDRNAGFVDLQNQLPGPAKVNALFRIEGRMTANGGSFLCEGSGYFRTEGGVPLMEGGGVVLLLTFGLGALFNARPALTWKG